MSSIHPRLPTVMLTIKILVKYIAQLYMYENAESHYIHRYILSLYINKSILSAIAYEMDVMNRWKSYMFVQYK